MAKYLMIKISTPGRICLFGEHQDYLGLPVIAAAISKRVAIEGYHTSDSTICIELPDIQQTIVFDLSKTPLTYTQPRDYFRSAYNILLRRGFTFSKGIYAEVRGNIPINAGTSSSSALLVSWLNFLSQIADEPQLLDSKKIGELAYEAEVIEFKEAGGMMDQYSTAIGNVIYLESEPQISVQALNPPLGTFVLGDSQQPKDTLGILKWVKFEMLDILEKIKSLNDGFSLTESPITQVATYKDFLSKEQYQLLKGNIDDRDILREALQLMQSQTFDHQVFGKLLSQHHANLRDAKRVSTPKIDGMIEAALNAGALGGKINGSGGGGCMFAYAPQNPEAVAEAIEKAGGKAYVIEVGEGTRIE